MKSSQNQTEAVSQFPTNQTAPVLLLSPHLDDVAFSAAAVVQAGPCQVWTVFAGEPKPVQRRLSRGQFPAVERYWLLTREGV